MTKHKTSPAARELYHGTNGNILDIIYTHGLQPPSDVQAADRCPVSGRKGLHTSLCGNGCEYCTERHQWEQCHMFGLGIYLADSAPKSHSYVSQPRIDEYGRQIFRIIVCSVLGKAYEVKGHLVSKEAMHDVVNIRALTESMVKDMVNQCQACFTETNAHSEAAHGDAATAEHSDLLFIRGLGACATDKVVNHIFDDVCNTCCADGATGVSVIANEYVAFHPHQCLPKYEIEYVLE